MRPLQLPTCMRRLYGASLADLIGPVAAKRGGQRGPNITKVTQHLSATPRPPTAPGPGWAALATRSASRGGRGLHRAHRLRSGRGPLHCRHLLRSEQS
eukprot:1135214-Pyramimonas_sp.AAC.1